MALIDLTGFIQKYPYTDFHELNLDWLIKEIGELVNEVTNFVSLNAIKYADPIQWDITRQYEKNTVVIDPMSGTAYLSVAAVPIGAQLNRPEYWTVIFDLGSFIVKAGKNFANTYEDTATTTATVSTPAGGWIMWGETLYKANVNITAGDAYVPGANITQITVEDAFDYLEGIIGNLSNLTTVDQSSLVNAINELVTAVAGAVADITTLNGEIGDLNNLTTTDKTSIVNAINEIVALLPSIGDDMITPELYGAVGDGVTDDTQAFIDMFAEHGFVFMGEGKTYIISDMINLPDNTYIHGNNATIKIKDNTRISDSIFKAQSVNNIVIEDLTLDMNMQNMPAYTEDRVVYYNIGFYCYYANYVSVKRCKFINLYNQSIVIRNTGGNIEICDNYFASPEQSQGYCAEHVVLQTISDGNTIKISNNIFDDATPTTPAYGVCSITSEGCHSQTEISNNYIANGGRNNAYNHRLAPIDLYGNNTHFLVTHNVVKSNHMFMRCESCYDMVVSDNEFIDISTTTDPSDEPFFWIDWTTNYPGVIDSTHDVHVINNKFYLSGMKNGSPMAIWNPIAGSIVKYQNIDVCNNLFDSNKTYPIIQLDGKVDDLNISDNEFMCPSGSVIAIEYITGSTSSATTAKHHTFNNNTFKTYKGIRIAPSDANLAIEDVTISNSTFVNGDISIQTNLPVLIHSNQLNNMIYDTIANTAPKVNVILGNIFDTSVGTPISSPSAIHKNNAKGIAFID